MLKSKHFYTSESFVGILGPHSSKHFAGASCRPRTRKPVNVIMNWYICKAHWDASRCSNELGADTDIATACSAIQEKILTHRDQFAILKSNTSSKTSQGNFSQLKVICTSLFPIVQLAVHELT